MQILDLSTYSLMVPIHRENIRLGGSDWPDLNQVLSTNFATDG
jgi:hypothetical protein